MERTKNLFEKKRSIPFRLANKFDKPSIIHNGVHYFPYDRDVKENAEWDGQKGVFIETVFNANGKLRQDTRFVSDDFYKQIIEYAKRKGIIQ